jgi:hypothetical protein
MDETRIEQQRIAEDVSEIKVLCKELAAVMHFVRRDQDDFKVRLDKIELAQQTCPARLIATAWGISMKDIAWMLALAAGLFGLWSQAGK